MQPLTLAPSTNIRTEFWRSLTQWVVPIGLLTLFVLYQSWPIFTEPQFYSDDQRSNWLLAIRQADPTFLQHDYAFGNPLFQGHYIPLYLLLLRGLLQLAGSVDGAMILLHSLMLPGYLIGMFVLLRYVTGNNLVAAFVAIVSALLRGSIAQEFWAATDMRAVMPRTAFLIAAPWLFLLLFRWLPGALAQSQPAGLPRNDFTAGLSSPALDMRRFLGLGLLAGLAANLHPPSGLFSIQIILTLIIVFSASAVSRQTLSRLFGVGVGAVIGGLPTLWAVLAGIVKSRQLTPAGTFQEFADILHWRMRTEFPFPPEQMNLAGISLESSQQSLIAILYLLGMGVWLAAAIGLRRQGRLRAGGRPLNWLLIGLVALNLPLVYLVSAFSALDLILVAAAYWASRLARRDDDALDRQLLAVLVCAAAYSFVASAVLGWFWQTFELWSLTSFFGEQARMSRFIYLPLYIFLARWLYRLWQQRQERATTIAIIAGLVGGLVVRHWHFLDAWGPAEWGMGFSLIALAVAGVWLFAAPPQPVGAKVILGISVSATAYLWLYIAGLVVFPGLWVLALLSGGLTVIVKTVWPYPAWRYLAGAAWLAVILFGLFGGPLLLTPADAPAPLHTQAVKTLGLYDYGLPSDRPDSLALYAWARTQTEPKALFYFNDRQYEFRFLAQRAVTHSWKDVGGGYYTPPLAIEYYRRFQKLEAAYENPDQLLACAQAYGVDYIITKPEQNSLDLPVAYANELYRVYAVDKARPARPSGVCG
ncbi:MAG: hypothetical protein KJ077_44395 [Anaerolineae bacterium]|nr:hypothetical protein [Anaerolineae bacterium]